MSRKDKENHIFVNSQSKFHRGRVELKLVWEEVGGRIKFGKFSYWRKKNAKLKDKEQTPQSRRPARNNGMSR